MNKLETPHKQSETNFETEAVIGGGTAISRDDSLMMEPQDIEWSKMMKEMTYRTRSTALARMEVVAGNDDWTEDDEVWQRSIKAALDIMDSRIPRRRHEVAWRIALFVIFHTHIHTLESQ